MRYTSITVKLVEYFQTMQLTKFPKVIKNLFQSNPDAIVSLGKEILVNLEMEINSKVLQNDIMPNKDKMGLMKQESKIPPYFLRLSMRQVKSSYQ